MCKVQCMCYAVGKHTTSDLQQRNTSCDVRGGRGCESGGREGPVLGQFNGGGVRGVVTGFVGRRAFVGGGGLGGTNDWEVC